MPLPAPRSYLVGKVLVYFFIPGISVPDLSEADVIPFIPGIALMKCQCRMSAASAEPWAASAWAMARARSKSFLSLSQIWWAVSDDEANPAKS